MKELYTPEQIAGAISARCYSDDKFREKFVQDPVAALSSIGITDIPKDVKIVPHVNDKQVWHVPVPQASSLEEMLDSDLEHASGGSLPAAWDDYLTASRNFYNALIQDINETGGFTLRSSRYSFTFSVNNNDEG